MRSYGGSAQQSSGGEGEDGSGARKPRLPKIQPNVNKRAQHIIAAHMQTASTVSAFSSPKDIVPVLSQLDSTAPTTAITHDISHLCDQGSCLRPRIPPSLIAEEDHIFEAGFLPKDATSAYSDADGLWHTKVFPSNSPSSREDAVMLDAWITKSLSKYATGGEGEGADSKEGLAQAVEDLVPILSVALHEIVRQVTHHCPERGTVLENIWTTYVELFDRVLQQMRSSLREQKLKTHEVVHQLSEAKRSLRRLRKEHPERLRAVIEELESKFMNKQRDIHAKIHEAENENTRLKEELRTHQRLMDVWYPGFVLYQDSHIKKLVPQFSGRRLVMQQHSAAATVNSLQEMGLADEEAEDDLQPEVAVAEDFKRLLAVLPPEQRRMIGQELAPVMDPKFQAAAKSKSRRSSRKQEVQDFKIDRAATVDVDKLHAEVQEQETYIGELRDEIARLEQASLGFGTLPALQEDDDVLEDSQDPEAA